MPSDMQDPRLAALGGSPSPAGVDAQIMAVKEQLKQVGEEQDKAMMAAAPRGKFTKQALGRFVSTLNKALDFFGAPEKLEAPAEDLTEFDPKLTSVVLMLSSAVNDAVKEAVLDPELAIDPSIIQTDADLRTVSAQLETAMREKNFKRWLMEEGPQAKSEGESETESEMKPAEGEMKGPEMGMPQGPMAAMKGKAPMGEVDIMKLFAQRA